MQIREGRQHAEKFNLRNYFDHHFTLQNGKQCKGTFWSFANHGVSDKHVHRIVA